MPAKGVVDRETRLRIAEHVKAKMEQLKIPTDAALARRLNVHRSTVGRVLNGKAIRLGLDVFIKLHRVLGIDATLMLDIDYKPPKGQKPSPDGSQSSQSAEGRGASFPP